MTPKYLLEVPISEGSSSSLFEGSTSMNVLASMKDTIKLSCPCTFKNERERKLWIFEHHREALLDAITLHDEEKQSVLEGKSENPEGSLTEYNSDNDRLDEAVRQARPMETVKASSHEEVSLGTDQDDGTVGDLYNKKRLELLDRVAHVQSNFLQSEGPKVVYTCLLNGILELMQSEFGFIGEVKYDDPDDEDTMYLQTHATTTVGWDKETIKYIKDHPGAVIFTDMSTLLGQVLTSKKPVICNDRQTLDNLNLPRGHPGIMSFLGIPLFERNGKIIGNICIANKRGARNFFKEEDIEFLKPFTVTGSNLIQAYWQVEKNKLLIDTLEGKVIERTTKLEDANKNLEAANRRVVQASSLQLQHFAMMSHEVRTPLNCVIGLSSLLQETSLTPQQDELLRMIVTSGDLLLTVVNDVLDYSKLESGNVEVEMKNSSLQEALNSTVHSIESKAKSKSIEIRTIYDTTVPEFLTIDSRRLQQVLYNLLGNSLKFSEEGGVIELAVSTGSIHQPSRNTTKGNNRRPTKDCLQSDEYIRFEVKDYGKGIESDDFEQIFQPFRQATAETERVYGGTGLGLAITAKLVDALGGSISVDSQLGQWTAFTVDLPLRGPPVQVDQLSETLQGVSLYLVTNDDEDNRQRLSRILERFQVTSQCFLSIPELEKHVAIGSTSTRSGSTKRYICLIQEDLFDHDAYRRISRRIPSVLTTFGPKYSVKETAAHYRSLLKVLPSVLIKSLAETCSGSTHKGGSIYSIENTTLRQDSRAIVNSVPIRDLRVLIAEDNIVNQKVLVRMLKRLGAENVDMASNGQEAVDREAKQTYDLILMDMQMPVMDGVQACHHIVNLRGNAAPRIIFVTAHAAESFEDECRKAGGTGFLPKPFSLNDISKCFQSLQIGTRR